VCATLLCWNVAGRVRRLPEQADRIIALDPDLVCLQEVRASTAVRWRERLAEAGWSHSVVAPPTRPRPLSVLTAAKAPLVPSTIDDVPWQERALSVCRGALELVNVHSPISPSPGLAKVLTHEAVHAHLAQGSGPRALCGDLNTPRKEHPDGRVWTFARTQHGKLRADRGERWDLAELALIRGLEPFGFRDAFRDLYGYAARELSWEWPRWGGGYRLDHLVVSDEVRVSRMEYLHRWRQDGLSDHSPLFASLSWASPPDGARG
jgi:exodeoxyribonuclease III